MRLALPAVVLTAAGVGLFVVGANQFDAAPVIVAALGLVGPGAFLLARDALFPRSRVRTALALSTAGLTVALTSLFAVSALGEYRSIIAAYIVLILIGSLAILIGLGLALVTALRHR